MKLTWWNQKTFDDVMSFYKEHKACAINNATGTGKTSVIAEVSKIFLEKGPVLIIAPRENILDQYKQDLYGLTEYGDRVTFVSYQQLTKWWKNGNENFEKNVGFSLIVCDELHRTGAKTWQKMFRFLIEINPQAYLLGASATPKRNDQKEERNDMIDVFFEGNRAGNFDLSTCLEQGILPKPDYIASILSMNDVFEKYRNMTETKIIQEKLRNEFLADIKEKEIDWKKSHEYDKILKRYLSNIASPDKVTKILIFCKDKKHVAEIRESFDPIFKEIFKDADNLNISEYHSGVKEKEFHDFRDCNDPGRVSILYSINKFIEGVHVNNLNAIIMVRETESHIVYFQQIGRVLSMSGVEHPLIIDFVSNYEKITGYDYSFLEQNLNVVNSLPTGEERNRTDRTISAFFYSEAKDAKEIVDKINNHFDSLVLYTYRGETNNVEYFAKKYNKDPDELKNKIKNLNMSIREAIETSDDVREDIEVLYEGEKVMLYDLCKRLKKNYLLILYRLDNGKTLEEALK